MRLALALVLTATACGLGVTGEEPLPSAAEPDAGPPASLPPPSTSSSGDAGPSGDGSADADANLPPAPNFCKTQTDPTVLACLDFDDDPKYAESDRGLDGIEYTGSYKIAPTLSDSPLGAADKQGIDFAFTDVAANEKRDSMGFVNVDDFKDHAGLVKHLSIDVDIVIDVSTVVGAVVTGFKIAGASCGLFSGVQVRQDGLYHRRTNGTTEKIADYQLGTPFHVRMDVYPVLNPGIPPKPEAITIGSHTTTDNPVYDGSCNVAHAMIGHYFADFDHVDSFHARFDRFVVHEDK